MSTEERGREPGDPGDDADAVRDATELGDSPALEGFEENEESGEKERPAGRS